MKKRKGIKVVLLIAFAIAVIPIGWFICRTVVPIALLIYSMNEQMTAGRKYMDSLKSEDFKIWMERSEKFIAEYDPKTSISIGYRPVPPELAELKILRIDQYSNTVSFVWLGGMDHTALEVEKIGEGNFKFTAIYNIKKSKVIWPISNNVPSLAP